MVNLQLEEHEALTLSLALEDALKYDGIWIKENRAIWIDIINKAKEALASWENKTPEVVPKDVANPTWEDCARCIHSLLFGNVNSVVDSQGNTHRIQSGNGRRMLEVGDYYFITQSPQEENIWGELVRRGAQISWMVRRSDKRSLVRVVDGEAKICP